MKRKIILFTFVFCGVSAIAQDIIVTTSAQKIDAKITEITKTELKYKEYDNLDGPLFVLPIEDIVTVIYANGKVNLFENASKRQVLTNESNDEIEAKTRAEAEALAKTKAGQIGSLFSNSSNVSDNGQKGKPVGYGKSGGSSWSLAGRECKHMGRPSNNFRQEGRVVVSIQVDAAGNVVSASESNGTTISDYATIQIALKAAKETKFSTSRDEIQIGTITYIFKFK